MDVCCEFNSRSSPGVLKTTIEWGNLGNPIPWHALQRGEQLDKKAFFGGGVLNDLDHVRDGGIRPTTY